jgi:tetratricopeptide (TPR) repeat protein
MDDQSQERLNQFRAESAALRRPSRLVRATWAAVIAASLAAGSWGVYVTVTSKAANAGGGPDAEQLRQYAVYLENKHLYGPAIEAYAKFLDHATLASDVRANVCYSVAKLAADEGRYETALAYLYQAEMFAPESNLRDEINKKVVFCLDKLGRSSELRHELRDRAGARRAAKDVASDEVILAEIGDSVITNRDLDRELDTLSPGAKQAFAAPEKKADFLKSLVAQRVLLDKGLRQELDKDPAVVAELEAERNAFVVQKLLDNEVATYHPSIK